MPFTDLFGIYALYARTVFGGIGLLILFGFLTRTSALFALVYFLIAIHQYGWYMVTYANYFGEIFVLLLVGSHKYSLEHWFPFVTRRSQIFNDISKHAGEYAFLFLRIAFGISLIYASVYAKVLHNQLAIAVVNDFNLTSVLLFDAQFIVLGAAIVEIMFGLFFIFGLEIRFTALALNVFLVLSLLYFGEAVWPHIILTWRSYCFFLLWIRQIFTRGILFQNPKPRTYFLTVLRSAYVTFSLLRSKLDRLNSLSFLLNFGHVRVFGGECPDRGNDRDANYVLVSVDTVNWVRISSSLSD